MTIFENGLIKLEYEPTTDILSVDMPTVQRAILTEVEQSLGIIVEHVRNYDVKKLLIDARKTEIEVPEEKYTEIAAGFARQLLSTRLQKVARIVSQSEVRENVVKKVQQIQTLDIQFQTFTDTNVASDWLKQ